jgi:hypothetical protein
MIVSGSASTAVAEPSSSPRSDARTAKDPVGDAPECKGEDTSRPGNEPLNVVNHERDRSPVQHRLQHPEHSDVHGQRVLSRFGRFRLQQRNLQSQTQ